MKKKKNNKKKKKQKERKRQSGSINQNGTVEPLSLFIQLIDILDLGVLTGQHVSCLGETSFEYLKWDSWIYLLWH